jgi:hypothetical protein
MFPWLFFWAPELNLPVGFAQNVEPNTNWFFGSIPPTAGDAAVEKQAFDVASYGRQLGLISEVLLNLAKQVTPNTPQARKSLERLRHISDDIENLKKRDAATLVEEIEVRLARLKRMHGARYPELLESFTRALGEDGEG